MKKPRKGLPMTMLLMLLFGLTQQSNAKDDLTIVDVRRNITLSDSDPVYKDFYINAGYASGLKKNLVVNAVRKINVRDSNGANAVGDMNIPVGKLRIIAVYDKVSVAREFEALSRDEYPMLEQTGIMSGDNIDLKGSYVDSSKPKVKKHIAEGSVTTESAIVGVAVVTGSATTPPVPQAQSPAATVPPPSATASNPTSPSSSPVETAKPESPAAEKIVAHAQPPANLPSSPENGGEMLEKTADSGNNSQHE